MIFNLVIFAAISFFVPIWAEKEQKVITKPPETAAKDQKNNEIAAEKKDSAKVQQKIADPVDSVKKTKVKFINRITKDMLGYQYGITVYPNTFKLQICNNIFTEYKNESDKNTDKSDVNNIITQKEIIVENNSITVEHEYTWRLSTYNGLKKQTFVLDDIDNLESIEVEFDWKQRSPHEHIVLKKKYKTATTTSPHCNKSMPKEKPALLTLGE